MNANRAIALFAIVVFAAIALTAIDKFEESSCRDDARENPYIRPDCEGFLPW